ncbi:hypothetical protein L873DRAFT_1811383 [Choiromyces venosus 120613-1]|uniref:Uncharacterized protein n=1 Tax=Choiromyces venosus 120613-1 TaxID=1336337 RepID=A0A3N4JRX3_9PEZI|nr:hypothetical protein L873DRAFT_1811383 [Choiromyces venosus 120613-1]
MASHNPCLGPVPTKSDDEGKWSQSLQETPGDPRYDSPFSPINHTYLQADPILIQNRSPGTTSSLEFKPTTRFEPTTSLGMPPPISVGGTAVRPSSLGIQENFGLEEANSSLSPGGPPAGNSALVTRRVVTK